MPFDSMNFIDSMDPITPDMKVAEVIERYPHAVEVFFDYGCPDMRGGFFGLMARLMSVRSAARMHRLPLGELVADLNAAAEGPEGSREQGAASSHRNDGGRQIP